MKLSDLRVLVIGAHPDDSDTFAGGCAIRWSDAGARVRFVSMCNGDKGHHVMASPDLAKRRLGETKAAARAFGIEDYLVCDTPDCEIEPTIALRKEMTRMVRRFAPHIILTHRLCDYHADHRAVSQLVQDMTYMLGLPNWCTDVPIPDVRPAVFFMTDDFDTPTVLRPDVIVPVDDVMERWLDAMACHRSQFMEFLPFDMGIPPAEVPPVDDVAAVRAFIDKWHGNVKRTDAARFAKEIKARFPADALPKNVEVFEMSRYGRQLDAAEIANMFGL